MNHIHVGETPRGNTFYLTPNQVGFEVNLNIGEYVLYEFWNRSEMTHEEVMTELARMEDEHAGSEEEKQIESGKGEQTEATEHFTEPI